MRWILFWFVLGIVTDHPRQHANRQFAGQGIRTGLGGAVAAVASQLAGFSTDFVGYSGHRLVGDPQADI